MLIHKSNAIIAGVVVVLVVGGGIVVNDLTKLTKDEVSKVKLETKYNASVEIKAKYQLDNTTLVKTEIKNAELDLYKGEPKDEIKVTLGDINSQEFTPDIELKRWNEVSFKLKPKGLETVATKDKDLSFVGDKVSFKTPKMDFEMVDVPATASDEGGYKYIWYLNEPPATNKIEFEISSQGLDFFYQPELTPEEIAEGASRPENVVGSYAVYHSTKGGMNDIGGKEYKTGKAFHIYRPHIIDANGAETWGILHIENGIYSVEIPQEFLDTAVYPIKSNDTFGYTSNGVSDGVAFANDAVGSLFTAPSGIGAIDSMSIRASDSFGGVGSKPIIVLHSSLNIVTNGTAPAITTIGALNWYTSTYSSKPTLTASTEYLLMAVFQYDDTVFKYDTGAANQGHIDTTNSYTTPANLGTATESTRKFSIYATYTPSGGGAAAPVIEEDTIIILN